MATSNYHFLWRTLLTQASPAIVYSIIRESYCWTDHSWDIQNHKVRTHCPESCLPQLNRIVFAPRPTYVRSSLSTVASTVCGEPTFTWSTWWSQQHWYIRIFAAASWRRRSPSLRGFYSLACSRWGKWARLIALLCVLWKSSFRWEMIGRRVVLMYKTNSKTNSQKSLSCFIIKRSFTSSYELFAILKWGFEVAQTEAVLASSNRDSLQAFMGLDTVKLLLRALIRLHLSFFHIKQ